MMYAIVAIFAASYLDSMRKAAIEKPENDFSGDTKRGNEVRFRLNEIDEIEKRLIEIESDLRISDEFSHIREITLSAEKSRLKVHLSRHKERVDEIS